MPVEAPVITTAPRVGAAAITAENIEPEAIRYAG